LPKYASSRGIILSFTQSKQNFQWFVDFQDSDERNACIKDLLAFVGEITQAEYGLNNSRLTKRRGKRKDGKDETKFKENVRVEQEKATVKEDKEGSTEVCIEKIDLKNKQTEALVNKVTEVFLEAN